MIGSPGILWGGIEPFPNPAVQSIRFSGLRKALRTESTPPVIHSRRADITELNLPSTMTIAFPEGKDKLLKFEITIKPDEGYYT